MTDTERTAFESGYIAGYMTAEKDFKRDLSLTAELIKRNNKQLIQMIRETAKINGNSEEVEKQLAGIGGAD